MSDFDSVPDRDTPAEQFSVRAHGHHPEPAPPGVRVLTLPVQAPGDDIDWIGATTVEETCWCLGWLWEICHLSGSSLPEVWFLRVSEAVDGRTVTSVTDLMSSSKAASVWRELLSGRLRLSRACDT
ncbi:hypothetical protein ACQEVF_57590 [Nonomuraea polychroma]|uniref:hypothetical protein n=1 Tax=Nonomuraea polychroma TaxID=46176 RepID=UPI003D90565A